MFPSLNTLLNPIRKVLFQALNHKNEVSYNARKYYLFFRILMFFLWGYILLENIQRNFSLLSPDLLFLSGLIPLSLFSIFIFFEWDAKRKWPSLDPERRPIKKQLIRRTDTFIILSGIADIVFVYWLQWSHGNFTLLNVFVFLIIGFHSYYMPSFIYYEGLDDSWTKEYSLKHLFTSSAFFGTILGSIYFAQLPFGNFDKFFSIFLVFCTANIGLITRRRLDFIVKDSEKKIEFANNSRHEALSTLREVIQDDFQKKDPSFETLAKLLGKVSMAEYCAVGTIDNDRLIDGNQWLIEPNDTRHKHLNEVKSCFLDSTSIIGYVLSSASGYDSFVDYSDNVYGSLIDGKRRFKWIHPFSEVYKKKILPSGRIQSMLIVGIYAEEKLDDDTIRKPIFYIHLINKMTIKEGAFQVATHGFNTDDLSLVRLIARQIEIITSNKHKEESLLAQSEILKQQNLDEQSVNRWMELENPGAAFDAILKYIAHSFDAAIASFWFPIWNGFEKINEVSVSDEEDKERFLKFNQPKFILRQSYCSDGTPMVYSKNGYTSHDDISIIDWFKNEDILSYSIGSQIPVKFGPLQRDKTLLSNEIFERLGINSFIALPVYRINFEVDEVDRYKYRHLIGIIYIKRKTENFEPTEVEQERLRILSRNLSLLLEKSIYQRRYQQINRLKNRIQRLRMNKEQDFYDEIVKIVRDMMRCEVCTLFMADDLEAYLELKASTAPQMKRKENAIETIYETKDLLGIEIFDLNSKNLRSLTTYVYKTLQTCLNYDEDINKYSDLILMEKTNRGKEGDLFKHDSFLAVPLIDVETKRPWGVIRCINKKNANTLFQSFTQADQEFLMLIAGILAGFIKYERWHNSSNRAFNIFAHDFRHSVNTLKINTNLQESKVNGLKTSINHVDYSQLVKYVNMNKSISDLLHSRVKELRNQLDSLGKVITSLRSINSTEYPLYFTLTQLIDFFQREAQLKQIKIEPHISQLQNKTILVDIKKIEAVFTNLIKNAIRYSDVGRENIKIYYREEEEFHVFDVVNWGFGVREDEKERVFEKGYRSSTARAKDSSGQGLGLYIVREIIEGHSGSVTFTRLSNPTVISFSLPKKIK